MVYGTPVTTSSTSRLGSERDADVFNNGRIYTRTTRSNDRTKNQNHGDGEALELLYRSSTIDNIVFNDEYYTGHNGSSGGWMPGTFRSSRTNKAARGNNSAGFDQQKKGTCLEDLMDTEDIAEFERRRELVPVRGNHLKQMLTGADSSSNTNNDPLVTKFFLARFDAGPRGLGYGVMIDNSSIIATSGVKNSMTTMGALKKRPLPRATDKKRLKLSISSHSEDDEDNYLVRPKKLRTLGTFITSGNTSIKKPGSTTEQIKFVGKSQRTASTAALNFKNEITKAGTDTIIFVRADTDLVVYTTGDSAVTTLTSTNSQKLEADTKDVKSVDHFSPMDRGSAPLVDTNRPEYQFLSQLSEELANRFHTATSSSTANSDMRNDTKLDSTEPAREVRPYVFNPLLLKRFGINPTSSLKHQKQQDKLEENEKQSNNHDAVRNSTHVNLHRNESFLQKAASRDLFNRIFG